jgi:Cu2+-exporting ATPase
LRNWILLNFKDSVVPVTKREEWGWQVENGMDHYMDKQDKEKLQSEQRHTETMNELGDIGAQQHQGGEDHLHTEHVHTAHNTHGHDHMAGHDPTMQQANHAGHAGHEGQMVHETHQGHGAHTDHTGHEKMFRRKFWISLLLSIPVLVFSPSIQGRLGFGIPEFAGSSPITPIFAVIVFLYGGVPFLQIVIPELKNRQPGMMTLISLAISVAFIYNVAALFLPKGTTFFWELVTLIDIMLLGYWIEMRSVRQASEALQELAKLMPDTVERIRPGDSTETVPVSELNNDDLVLIRPGASIPADGEVQQGESEVNEAMITGESQPVKKHDGDKVIAGTINGDGSLYVRVTATGDQTALAGIMRLVGQAQQSKSNTQILADKDAGWLFYMALGAAVITAIAWTIAIGFNVDVIARVATVLVIACPHALGLAVPLVVSITTSLGARNGILVRDRLALEKSRLIDTVVFEKTGTLTEGEFGVVAMKTIEGWKDNEALALAAAVEGDSEHTIARGIHKSALEKELHLPEVSGFEAIKGKGARAHVTDGDVYVGGPQLMEMLQIRLPEELEVFTQQASQKGHSVIHLIKQEKAIASFSLADVIRPESKQVVERLHQMGMQVAMLTGDSRAVAQSATDELGIDTYFAEVLPENKDQKVVELQQQGKQVAMVGDSVNDAPALVRADVWIAIGSGTDVAIESAGIILVKNNPLDVVHVIELNRASHRKMVQNLWWAAGYNIFALPLAAGVLAPLGILLSPAVGALLMSISTIIVAINAQLMKGQSITSG